MIEFIKKLFGRNSRTGELRAQGTDMYGKIRVLELGPQYLTPEELEAKAVERGTEAGHDSAIGNDHGEALEEHAGRRGLAEEINRRKERISQIRSTDHAVYSADKTDVENKLEHLNERLDDSKDDLREIKQRWDELPKDVQTIGNLWYSVVLTIFGFIEYPSVSAAIQTIPLGATGRQIFAVVLCIIFVAAAHYLSSSLYKVATGLRRKGTDWGQLFLHILIAPFLLVVSVFVLVRLGDQRESAFGEIARITGDTLSDPGTAADVLYGIQVLIFVAAILVGIWHAAGAAKRALRRERWWMERKVAKRQKQVNELKRQQGILVELLNHLDEETENRLRAEDKLLGSLYTTYDYQYARGRKTAIPAGN